jgi:hypothetical protein
MTVRALTPTEKIGTFVALLVVFLIVAWPDRWLPLVNRLFLVFSVGAGISLWKGREQGSMFRPATLAAWAIIFGVVMMGWSFAMLLFVRFRT